MSICRVVSISAGNNIYSVEIEHTTHYSWNTCSKVTVCISHDLWASSYLANPEVSYSMQRILISRRYGNIVWEVSPTWCKLWKIYRPINAFILSKTALVIIGISLLRNKCIISVKWRSNERRSPILKYININNINWLLERYHPKWYLINKSSCVFQCESL